MKKRKELDALVSNGKIGSSKRINCGKKASGSCSAHELLRHDTDSSDIEDFSILQPRRKGRKKHGSRLCITSVCLSLCQFILVTTSCLVSGALIWLHIGLREDIDLLRAHLQKVEAGNRNTPEALHVIHSNLKQLDSNVTMLYIDARKSIADIENITNEVKFLKDTTSSLKASIASAPAIQQLPKDMHSLSESVANFGSKLNALESNVKELKDQQSNMQTTWQNLSGELDSMKLTVQDLTNSSDYQAKSSGNVSAKDSKLQAAFQEINQHVESMQGQLMDIVKSFDKINASVSNQLSVYHELPARVETVKEAIVWINNATSSYNSRISALETFIYTNLTLRLDQLDPDRLRSFQMSGTGEMGDFVNKSISDAIQQLISKGIFHGDIQKTNNNNALQSLEETHDVLVLLAALLQKFDQIPTTYILTNKNSSELVENMLHQVFEGMVGSRDVKIENIEQELKNLSLCIPLCHKVEVGTESGHMDDITTPVFVQSTLKAGNSQNENSQMQLAEALG
ncbi:EF-hand calcium-binding domain-containing protein 14 [Nephila pilipes]|uniref:EF-hand calcium-binding domain-containing protein 14 n=1 Tax=Nephila pilipes TaxID=299642 RepID=A0A8X6TIK0_NEPPI|nr:EF-hand calcium-binding domain-containing protein 14 [Nephila pilipes]